MQSTLYSVDRQLGRFYGRCGGIYRHPDPLALAPSIFRRDTVHITDHRQERDNLRPLYVHLPCHLRAQDGFFPCMCNADPATYRTDVQTPSRKWITSPGSRASDPFARAPLSSGWLICTHVSQLKQRIHINHDHSNAVVSQEKFLQEPGLGLL